MVDGFAAGVDIFNLNFDDDGSDGSGNKHENKLSGKK